jgi:hypothetical protein
VSTRLPFARFEARRDGYERWRSYEDGRERYVYVHRLAAVAWGILDGLDDPRHVHHINGVPWCNTEDNFEAVDERTHAEYHIGRRARA